MIINLIKNKLRIKYLNRLFFLFITFFFFQTQISEAQQVSLSNSRLTLRTAFTEIERQTDMSVDYNREIIDVNKTVSIPRKEGSLSEIMTTLLQGTGCAYVVRENHIVISKVPVTAQQTRKNVAGIITDQQGDPIIGANIVEKGTTNGTVTDIDGEFTLNVENNAVLLISYIGYLPQEVVTTGLNTVNPILQEDTKALEEVVVVGYGTQKRVNLTGAVSAINANEIAKRQVGQSSMLLQGMAPGVTVIQRSGQPGSDGGSIRIRGIGTLSDANPLVLVDGVEMSINNIDPNLIENISILKDAASASIYGSRAANGVILVTTRRADSSKPSFNYNGYVGWQQPTDLPKKVNAIDHMTLMDEANKNMGNTLQYQDLIKEYREFGRTKSDYYPDTDWQKEMLRTGFTKNHFLSASAGTDKLKLLASLAYLNQQGNLENTEFERYSFRINADMKISNALTLKLDAFMRHNKRSNPVATTTADISQSISTIFFQMNRLPANIPGIFSNGLYGEGATSYNPIAWVRDGGTMINRTPNALISMNAIFKPVEWLTADFQFTPYYVMTHEKIFQKAIDLYNPDGTLKTTYPTKTSLKEQQDRTLNKTLKTTLLADKSFKNHNAKLLLGFSREDMSNEWFSAYREIFIFPEYEVLNAGGDANKDNGGSAGEWALQSFFGRINYDYKGKYLFEVNGRYDGTSRFIQQNRYSFFPSVSLGWRISEETFMVSTREWLNNLKIRSSWGKLGNQNIGGNYPYSSNISITHNYSFGGTIVNGARMRNMANTELKWESTEMWNAGLDIALFQKFSLTADLYSRETSGILLMLDIPGIVGLNAPYQNAGVVTNKGWELGLSYNDRIGDFKYDISANIADVKNRVVDLKGITQTSLTQSREGYPINSIYGHVALGLFKDEEDIANSPIQQFGATAPGDIKYKDLNDDGVINAEDQEIIGSTIPRYTYSVNINMNWRSFDFSMFWQGVGKADGYLNSSAIIPFFNGGTVQEQHKDRWTQENQNLNAAFPRLAVGGQNQRNSTWWLKDASYLRLKNVNIGYNFSGGWLDGLGVNNVRFYLSGENLLTFDRFWDGFDPEAPVGSGSYYPQLKTYTIGLNIRF